MTKLRGKKLETCLDIGYAISGLEGMMEDHGCYGAERGHPECKETQRIIDRLKDAYTRVGCRA